MPTITPEQLRMATALAHAVEGADLVLDWRAGTSLRVRHGAHPSHATPCQLRAALLLDGGAGAVRVAEALADLRIVAGLVHVGGGLYATGRGSLGQHRWFATTLPATALVDVLADAAGEVRGDGVEVQVRPDDALGVTVARVSVEPPCAASLDEVAVWALGRCLVGELDRHVELQRFA